MSCSPLARQRACRETTSPSTRRCAAAIVRSVIGNLRAVGLDGATGAILDEDAATGDRGRVFHHPAVFIEGQRAELLVEATTLVYCLILTDLTAQNRECGARVECPTTLRRFVLRNVHIADTGRLLG